MLSEENKKTIDSLTMEELLTELMKQERSRFQGEMHDYLLSRYALIEKQQEDEHKSNELTLAKDANNLAAQANQIAKDANKVSLRAYRISALSVVVALVALVISLVQRCTSGP
jgi:hypothetical protein